jgi:hypothetical protein
MLTAGTCVPYEWFWSSCSHRLLTVVSCSTWYCTHIHTVYCNPLCLAKH